MADLGPRSKKVTAELAELEAKRNQVAEEEAQLAREVVDRQGKVDVARAQGVVGGVDHDQVRAFEGELEALQSQLAESRSTLAGLEQLLEEKRQALRVAQEEDAQEAIVTGAMAKVVKDLEHNARRLDKARKAILTALEAGAVTLLKEIGQQREEFDKLVDERGELYRARYRALGAGAGLGDSSFERMRHDGHVQLFSSGYDREDVLALVELLLPLVNVVEARCHWDHKRPWLAPSSGKRDH